ncbi:XdhC/CoxI family protein [bacterium]|nr:MAG: XdhC/CoxI family protein [bacterium]
MDIIAEIVSALRNRERLVLATIVSSSGSTPLPPGASMLVQQHGKIVRGTIGGGLLEASVTKEAEQFSVESTGSVIRQFELNESDSEDGMICGGTVEILLEQIGEEELSLFSGLIVLKDEGSDCTLLRITDSTKSVVKRSVLEGITKDVTERPPLDGLLKAYDVPVDRFLQSLQRAHREESVKCVPGLKGEMIIQPIVGIQPLIIFGGGHIGRSLSKIAPGAGFTVTVVDDRQEYAHPGRFRDDVRTLTKSWSDAFADLHVKPSASIVIVTRGHESDKEVLRHALRTPARYIGMIGSGKKVTATYARLQEEGVPIALLRRVHAPIGLEIGAVSAEEIAVSIVAELIQVRRRSQSSAATMSKRMKQWFDKAEE